MIAKAIIRKYNVAMHGDYNAGVLTGMEILTGTPLFTTMLQTVLKKVPMNINFFTITVKFLARSLFKSYGR